MKILFVGDEEEYASSIQSGESGTPFSLFFCASLDEALDQGAGDAVVIPALRFLSSPPSPRFVPLIASGPAEVAEACFEARCSDFIRVPWTEDELLARVSGRIRDCVAFNHDGLSISGHRLMGPASEIDLSDGAYSILMLLAHNMGRPVPRIAIASLIGAPAANSRSIDMRVARLRAALRSAGAEGMADRLRCTHGAYRLCT